MNTVVAEQQTFYCDAVEITDVNLKQQQNMNVM